jgi:hypothetical protein
MKHHLLSIDQPDGDPPPSAELNKIMRNVAALDQELTAAGRTDGRSCSCTTSSCRRFLQRRRQRGAAAGTKRGYRGAMAADVAGLIFGMQLLEPGFAAMPAAGHPRVGRLQIRAAPAIEDLRPIRSAGRADADDPAAETGPATAVMPASRVAG